MKIGVIHNFQKRGGDFVTLNILKSFAKTDNETYLITSTHKEVKESLNFFDARKKDLKINIRKLKSSKFIPSPYSKAYMASRVEKDFDVLVLNDDVPKNLNTPLIVYVHYPGAARISPNFFPPRKRGFIGNLKLKFHQKLFPKFFYCEETPDTSILLANSTLTEKHTKKTLNPNSLKRVYPPVNSEKIKRIWSESKESRNSKNLAIFLGFLTPRKGIKEILKSLELLRGDLNIKFKIIGKPESEKYLVKLSEKIKELGIDNKFEILPRLSRKRVISELIEAKYIIHPMKIEPFGISVVEGMAAGCVPIVRKGLNGPWIDITKKGKYGIGFEDSKELAKILKKAESRYQDFNVNKIIKRSLEFNEKIFEKDFTEATYRFLSETKGEKINEVFA